MDRGANVLKALYAGFVLPVPSPPGTPGGAGLELYGEGVLVAEGGRGGREEYGFPPPADGFRPGGGGNDMMNVYRNVE